MRRAAVAFALLAAAAAAQERADTAARFLAQEEAAFRHYRAQDWPRAIAAFEAQIAIYPDHSRPYYNIACCWALQGDAERAATWLRITIGRGWRDAEHLARDPDFDGIRDTDAFRACVAELARARAEHPDPLPDPRPPHRVPSARSAAAAVGVTALRERLVRAQNELAEPHDRRRELFAILDERMGRLHRYLLENGDARDAQIAAHERVRTAMQYLEEADPARAADAPLADAAARLVRQTAAEFQRGWAGSALAPDVRLWQAQATRHTAPADAVPLLESLRRDHPGTDAGFHASVELASVLAADGTDPRLAELVGHIDGEAAGRRDRTLLARRELDRARLFVHGVARWSGAPAGDDLKVLVFAFADDPDSEARLRELDGVLAGRAGVHALALCVAGEDGARWLATHARGWDHHADAGAVAEACHIARIPTVVVYRDPARVLAVDPDAAALRALLGE